jgi:hypothetical protein
MCHDYKAPGRDHYAWETTVGEQRAGNTHVKDGIDEGTFVAMREARDATPTIANVASSYGPRGEVYVAGLERIVPNDPFGTLRISSTSAGVPTR